MGYACPVCEAPQADGEHLANHVAITAMLHEDTHADWLDEHAPGWEETGPEELADRIVDAVPETEFPQVFEDTTRDHDHGGRNEGLPFEQELARQAGGRGPGRGTLTGETREIVAEARDLTRQMLDDDADERDRDDADGLDRSDADDRDPATERDGSGAEAPDQNAADADGNDNG